MVRSGSRPRRPARCTSAAPAPRCSTGSSPATTAARSSCASRTPTSAARARSGSTAIQDDAAVARPRLGRGRRSSRATRFDRVPRRGRRGCSPPGTPTSATAPRTSSTRAQRRRKARRAARRATTAAAVTSTPTSGRRARGRGPAPHDAVPHARRRREHLHRPRPRRGERRLVARSRDFVIVRSDGSPIFFLANAVDDLDDGHHARDPGRGPHRHDPPGAGAARTRCGAGRAVPMYAHLPLIVEADRAKLSKRHGAVAVEDFRDRGLPPGGAR